VKDLFNTSFLFASLVWGSVGVGYFVYGKRQSAPIPLVAGILMIGVSYFVSSWLLMSLICLAMIFAVYWLLRQGY